MKIRFTLAIMFICSISNIWGQQAIFNEVEEAKTNQQPVQYPLFAASPALQATKFNDADTIALLQMDELTLVKIKKDQPDFLRISIPLLDGTSMQLDVLRKEIHALRFGVANSKNQSVAFDKGTHYQGVIDGKPHSLVSLSFLSKGMQGFVADAGSHYELAPAANEEAYALFHPNKDEPLFNCTTPDEPVAQLSDMAGNNEASTQDVAFVGCRVVEVYFEADFSVFTNRGSVQATLDYVNTIFAQVAALYANESIGIVMSQLLVWDAVDPYVSHLSTADYLPAFANRLRASNFPGDLAHALSFRSLGGGRAYLDVLCNRDLAFAVSGNLQSTTPAFPSYSWNVNVVAHELGHNFGSPHTHNCSWPGGPIDNCAPVENGNCPAGPSPTNGGTTMSYCHLNIGINPANGFGQLPGNLMRNRTMACLGTSLPPENLTVNEIYGNQAILSWDYPMESVQATVEYRPIGSSIWFPFPTSAKWIRLQNLKANTPYEWRVKSACSAYAGSTFTTNNSTNYCDVIFSQNNGCNTGLAINAVKVGNAVLSSNSRCNIESYTYFPKPVTDLAVGVGHPFIVEMVGYSNPVQIAIWLDLNKNGVFDESEQVFITDGAQNSAIYGSFTIPQGTAYVSRTRMRIVSRFSAAPTEPCGNYSAGEVEDYIVNLVSNCTENTWIGGTSSNWHLAANWSCQEIPGANTHVTIPAGTPFPCEVLTGNTGICLKITASPGANVGVKENGKLNVVGE